MTIGGADWLLVNLRTSGFYRVNYDQENWERLLAQLDTNHQVVGIKEVKPRCTTPSLKG
jgi:hypothetical protein